MTETRKKKSGVFVWGVMGFLILGLGGFGLTGAFQTSGGSTVASVGNEEISADAYLNGLQQDLRRASQQFGQNITLAQARIFGIDQSSLRRQLVLAALTNEAKRLNLSVGDEAVRDVLLSNLNFQVGGGVFSEATYDLVLNQQRITREEYESLLRSDKTQTVISGAISGAVGPQETAARVLMDFIGETRDIIWAEVDASVLADEATDPTEAEIQAYYDANPEAFTTPETRKITYAMLSPQMLATDLEITDEAILEVYDDRQSLYNTPERRIVDRIIFGSADDAAEAMARLDTGDVSFEDIAGERNLTANEYSIGIVRANQLSTAAAELLFASSEPGLYGPVAATLGPAIFRVNAALDSSTVSLEDARADIRDALAAEQAGSLMLTKIGNIDDLIASGASLEELADETDMVLFTIDYSTAATEHITTDPAFNVEALTADIDEERDLIELANGGILALRVNEIAPAALRSLSEARAEVVAGATAAATVQRVQDYADELVAQIGAGADLAATLGALEITPNIAVRVTRTSPPSGLPPLMALEFFDQAEGEAKAYQTATGAIIIEVSRVQIFDPLSDDGKTFLAQAQTQLKDDIASDIYILFANAMLGSADVTVNQGMIDQIILSLNGN
ncbi:MAG: SurA N-terminal domain-containing protein [Rhodobacteraceae bacterium]|nr:SurA N-terminal domain-containing protein [Paracoccaceae bacterium]